jgi:nucleotide-binding universal stress UspA family protein
MFKKILICLDGSELAEQILPYAEEQALHFNSKLVLIRVYSEPGFIGLAVPGFPGIPVETQNMGKQIQKEEQEAEKYLKTVADKLLKQRGLAADCVTVLGAAGEAIVNYAVENKIELIAIATHGRSGPGRMVMGSVADYVLHNAHLPVLLIRPEVKKT